MVSIRSTSSIGWWWMPPALVASTILIQSSTCSLSNTLLSKVSSQLQCTLNLRMALSTRRRHRRSQSCSSHTETSFCTRTRSAQCTWNSSSLTLRWSRARRLTTWSLTWSKDKIWRSCRPTTTSKRQSLRPTTTLTSSETTASECESFITGQFNADDCMVSSLFAFQEVGSDDLQDFKPVLRLSICCQATH